MPQKLSKAAKRRLKKEEEEKANQARINAAIKESEAAFMRGEKTPRQQELQSVQEWSKLNLLKYLANIA